MDNLMPVEVEQSKFQKYQKVITDFLTAELKKEENSRILYTHQILALKAVQNYFEGPELPSQPALIVAPTGSGKTGIVTLLPYVLGSPKAVILSPSVVITDQLEKALGLREDCQKESFMWERKMFTDENKLKDFLELGKRMTASDGVKNIHVRNLVIVNAQKFGGTSSTPLALKENHTDEMKREIKSLREKLADFSTLIVDEAHHYPAATWDAIVKEFKGKQVIFLTATPFRGCDCDELWEGQEITYTITKKVLEENKIIRPAVFKCLNNLEAGDFFKIGKELVKILKEHDEQEPTVKHKAMVLVGDTEDAENGAQRMGEKIATYHTSDKSTNSNLKRFESDNAEIRILFVCGKLLEGYDNSNVSVCMVHRNVRSFGLFTQFVGRCIRTSKRDQLNRDDSVTANIVSLPCFEQDLMFEKYKRM